MATDKQIIETFEKLSDRPGEFDVEHATDVNGLKTTRVINNVTKSLVAEVNDGDEDRLVTDPGAPTGVDHRQEEVTPTEIKDGEVQTEVNKKEGDEPTDEQKAAAQAKKDKAAADKKAKAETVAKEKEEKARLAAQGNKDNTSRVSSPAATDSSKQEGGEAK